MKKGILNLAIQEAEKSTYKQRLGAVIFDKKRIISVGRNHGLKSAKKLHPKFQKWFGSIHAEVACILNARTCLTGFSILVVRINNQGNLMYSKPCPMCASYLEYVGIKDVYFINKTGEVTYENIRP